MRQFAQSRHKHTWPHGCIIISTFSIKHTLQPPVSRDGLSLSIVFFCRLSSSLSCSFSSLLSFAVWNQNKAASVANNNQKSSNNLKVIILYMITYLYTLYDVFTQPFRMINIIYVLMYLLSVDLKLLWLDFSAAFTIFFPTVVVLSAMIYLRKYWVFSSSFKVIYTTCTESYSSHCLHHGTGYCLFSSRNECWSVSQPSHGE